MQHPIPHSHLSSVAKLLPKRHNICLLIPDRKPTRSQSIIPPVTNLVNQCILLEFTYSNMWRVTYSSRNKSKTTESPQLIPVLVTAYKSSKSGAHCTACRQLNRRKCPLQVTCLNLFQVADILTFLPYMIKDLSEKNKKTGVWVWSMPYLGSWRRPLLCENLLQILVWLNLVWVNIQAISKDLCLLDSFFTAVHFTIYQICCVWSIAHEAHVVYML